VIGGRKHMEIARLAVVIRIVSAILFVQGFAADAVEVKLKVADPLTAAISELGPQFERDTGYKLITKFTPGPVVKRDIDAGEAFDFAISITPLIDALIKEGKIVAGTRADVAYSGIGVGVRANAPKPDISSVEAFKRALLNVKSVAYAAQGASGTYFKNLVERLGIAEQMKPKLKPLPFDELVKAVPSGEAEMIVVTISIIVAGAAELVGPVPTELQFYNSFAAGVGTDAKQAETAKQLIKFITGPAAVAVLKASGMEPGAPR
jgi:molybdate transport system substrate-binding protein